jgi:hypothetical protein
MPLYEVAVLKIATKKEVEDGAAPEELVFGPAPILAKDDKTAALKALTGNQDKLSKVDLDKAQVIIRPFA